MLVNGEAVTTVQEGQHVCVTTDDWAPIAEVTYVEAELEYDDFMLEDTYTLSTTEAETFDVSRLVRAASISEFINEPEKDVVEIMATLAYAGGSEPALDVEALYSGLSGTQLLTEIDLMERGLKNLMQVAYDAGKAGMELI